MTKKSHSGPTIPQAEREARGQVKITVRTTTEVRDRATVLREAGYSLSDIFEAGCAALETK